MVRNKHMIARVTRRGEPRQHHGRIHLKKRAPPKRYVIGIDEVGRGPLAGPVVVAAVFIPKNKKIRNKNLPPLRDSKRLSEKQREIWFDYLKRETNFKTARITPPVIDRINITRAANLAASRALSRLMAGYRLPASRANVFLDGGLFLNKRLAESCGSAKTIIHGDKKIPIVALASIIAKVTRDRYMKKTGKKYPVYRFEEHKGYGTRNHYKALRKYGTSKLHRLTFIKEYLKVGKL